VMFDIHLKTFDRSGLFGLEFPWLPRVMALLIAFVVAGATFGGDPPLVGILLIITLVLAGIYEERWVVDAPRRTVTSRVGLIVFAKTKQWSFDEIAGFELNEFVRGAPSGPNDLPGYKRFRKRYVRLTMRFQDAGWKVIETTSARYKEELREQGERFAQLCGVNLTSS
jgi:hypothetical protein